MKDAHPRIGSFDTIRLLAAFAVFHSHSFALAGRPEPAWAGNSLGGAAVLVFFVVSGYWISHSALQRDAWTYATARVFRIVPGLLVCCLLTIAACALASSVPVNDYFRQPATWRLLQNAFPFFCRGVGDVPGVFEDGAVHGVNFSLWTLRYEVLCYVVIGVAALFGRAGVRAVMFGAAVIALAVLVLAIGTPPGTVDNRPIELLDGFQLRWLAMFLSAFMYGAWLREQEEQTLRRMIAVGAIATLLAWHDTALAPPATMLLYGSVAIWVGRNLNLDRSVTRGQDISYGFYIYAFPVQQLVARAIWPSHAAAFAGYYLVSLVISLGLAWLSWRLVEKPALAAKTSIAAKLRRIGAGVLRAPSRASAAVPH